jgi:hypothetical protein
MRPFQQFRLWARRAPLGERTMAALAAATALAALTWLAIPPVHTSSSTVGNRPSSVSEPSGSQQGGSNSTGSSAPVSNGGGVGQAAAPGGGALGSRGISVGATTSIPGRVTTSGGGCVSPPGSDQGVSATQIKVGVTIIDLAGANSAVGVPSPAVQQSDYQAMINYVNKTGGAACRQIVPDYFHINTLDQSSLQQACINATNAGLFFYIDLGGFAAYPSIASCFPQNHIPFYEQGNLPLAEMRQYYPYLFGAGSTDLLYFNTVYGLNQLGFFKSTNGFKKLGIVYNNCIPQEIGQVQSWLHDIGVPAAEIVTYNYGCAQTFYPNPSDAQQAVLNFQSAGVTNVMALAEATGWFQFTHIAANQGYQPKYGLPDEFVQIPSYSATGPDWSNAAGTILIAPDRFGEEHTPGTVPNAATQKCNQIMAAAGITQTAYQQPVGMSGLACDQFWLLLAAVQHIPAMQRADLLPALLKAGTIDFAYPASPASFPTDQTTWAGNFWRPVTAVASCQCWSLTSNTTFQPSFPNYPGS